MTVHDDDLAWLQVICRDGSLEAQPDSFLVGSIQERYAWRFDGARREAVMRRG
jgi:hypothetical protein